MTIPTAALDSVLHSLHGAAARAAVRARWFGRPVLAAASADANAPEDLLPLPARWRPDATTFFWERPADGRAVLGLGTATALRTGGAARIANLRADIRRLVDTAVTAGDASPAAPLLVGGLGFAAQSSQAGVWSAFPPALFFVPRVLVARRDGECLVRLAVLVEPDADIDRQMAAMAHDIERLLDGGEPSPAAGLPAACTVTPWPPVDEWVRCAGAVVDDIRAGRIDKLVLARTCAVHAGRDFQPAPVVRRLRRSYPTCTTFWLAHEGSHFVGATPELLVTLSDGHVTTGAVAGSAPRGRSAEADRSRQRGLRDSAKERWEHALVVDAMAAALRPLCTSLEVGPEAQVLTLENVHHLRTSLTARARQGVQLLDLVGALHPTPAVAGHPRAAAVAALQQYEPFDRGWYAAPIGWLGADGGGEMAVAIRCALLNGAHALLYAGAGLVRASEPAAELAETEVKLQPLLKALAEGVRV